MIGYKSITIDGEQLYNIHTKNPEKSVSGYSCYRIIIWPIDNNF